METVALLLRPCVAIADAGEERRQIVQSGGDEVDDFSLALDAAVYSQHAGGKNHAVNRAGFPGGSRS